MSTVEPYEMELTVQDEDIDQLGHVNNVVYLRWVQDIAIAHWYAAATEEQKTSLLWVVAKHEIEYKRPAVKSDTLVIRTRVGEATHRRFARHTEILRKSDRKLLAKAVTYWVPIDAETKNPVKAGNDVYAMFSTQNGDMETS